jgi:hypothetical protein
MEDLPLKEHRSQPQGGLFKEVNDLRKKKPSPEADDAAKFKDSFFGRLAANKKFEALTFVFIGVNSLYIGIDADVSATVGKPDDLYDPKTPLGFIIMENIFCIYFTFEVVVRFIGFKSKHPCSIIKDKWFMFDGTLVTMMVLETWIFPVFGIGGALSQLSVLRLLRLLRISRMARLMKKVPELMIIIKGLIASFRSVSCTAILQVLILYVWSILFVSEYHEKGPDDEEEIASYFGTMGKSMFSLFIYGTVLDDVTACTDAIRGTENVFMLSLFIVFILISSFTILNMLIGILCEVVSATAESEKTKAVETSAKEAITTLFEKMDVDGSGTITQEEFMHMRDDETVRQALEEMDIYESHFTRYCELLFQGKKAQQAGKPPVIDFEALITMLLRLSPGNHINALDFSLLQASIDRTQECLRDRVLGINSKISEAMGKPPQALGGESPQPPNTDGSDLRGAASSNTSVPVEPSLGGGRKEYTMDMFVRTSSHQIIEELERRLGVSALEAIKPSPALAGQKDSLVQGQDPQAFHSLGVPEE